LHIRSSQNILKLLKIVNFIYLFLIRRLRILNQYALNMRSEMNWNCKWSSEHRFSNFSLCWFFLTGRQHMQMPCLIAIMQRCLSVCLSATPYCLISGTDIFQHGPWPANAKRTFPRPLSTLKSAHGINYRQELDSAPSAAVSQLRHSPGEFSSVKWTLSLSW